MDYAICEIAGKQYKVKAGQTILVNKLAAKENDKVTFDSVVLHSAGDKVSVGAPFVENIAVTGTVLGEQKMKKIHVLRFRAKSHYHKARGHRAQMTKIRIDTIGEAKSKKA